VRAGGRGPRHGRRLGPGRRRRWLAAAMGGAGRWVGRESGGIFLFIFSDFLVDLSVGPSPPHQTMPHQQ
jgi:hypothetical protein